MFIFKESATRIASILLLATVVGANTPRYGLGTPVSESDLAPWNIDVAPDGAGLPNGRGSVTLGEQVFATKCAVCHGVQTNVPLWGRGPLTKEITIGNYWPYATTIFDFVRRAMPLSKPQSLTAEETYAVTAYILWKNDIVKREAVMDKHTLPRISMPNRNGFIWTDPRPDAP